jgi:hypothetical protein
MDTFLAIPTSSSVSLSPVFMDTMSPMLEMTTIVTPNPVVTIEPLFPFVSVAESRRLVPTVTTMVNPNSSSFFYYDSGIGSNPLAQHETNEYLRYKFLDKELVEEHKDILSMLKIDGGNVSVAKDSKSDVGSTADVEKKVDFIGNEILTRSKNMKILRKIIDKNYHLKFYDLPHNIDLVFSTQAKYIKQKLKEMR